MKFRFVSLFVAALLLSACSDDPSSPAPQLQVPSVYDTTTFSASTVLESNLKADVNGITAVLKSARVSGVRINQGDIASFRDRLRSSLVNDYRQRFDNYINEAVKASGGSYDWTKSPVENGDGGVYGAYLFEEHGLELEQLVEKGMFSAALYHQAVQLMDADVTATTIDRILSLWGAHPSFPNSDRRTVNPDRLSAAYAARRDKADGNGFYSTISRELIRAQAAAKAGSSFNAEKADALTKVRRAWEESIMATVINYGYSVISKLAAANPSDADRSSAMHAYGEMVGFITGWRGIPQKKISDGQIDELLIKLRAPASGDWRCYEFWQQPSSTLTDIESVMNSLQSIYGFSNSQMEDFRQNWTALQDRK